jgi:predicted ribosomally synthesized peptide with nif11-like leader
MSQASATDFLEKANTDPQIRQRIQSLGPGAELEDVLDVAAASGYKISEQDIMEAAKAKAEAEGKPGDQELSEAELDQIAGGFRLNLSIIKITKGTVVVSIKSTF